MDLRRGNQLGLDWLERRRRMTRGSLPDRRDTVRTVKREITTAAPPRPLDCASNPAGPAQRIGIANRRAGCRSEKCFVRRIRGSIRLGQLAKQVIERKFGAPKRAETVGFSHGDLSLVLQSLDNSAGKQLLSAETIADHASNP